MSKVVLTVHEFTTVMGHLDQRFAGTSGAKPAIYDAWFDHWQAVEKKMEGMGPMERADMLFDGKITINALSAGQLEELIDVVESQITFHETLIKDADPDADPEDLDMWKGRLKELRALERASNWSEEGA